ncbi:MAG: hypothetical protein EYC62_07330 [Alphaproteobacteria bacterium]|nr:MAG: hypothetical protein EYC62_07330 [Alphaproteobacteria bacterium]
MANSNYKVVTGAAAVFAAAAMLGGCSSAPKTEEQAGAPKVSYAAPRSGVLNTLGQVTDLNPSRPALQDNGFATVGPVRGQPNSGFYTVDAIVYSPVQKADVVLTGTINETQYNALAGAYAATKARHLFSTNREIQFSLTPVTGAEAEAAKSRLLNRVSISTDNSVGVEAFVFDVGNVKGRVIIDNLSANDDSKIVTFTNPGPFSTPDQVKAAKERLLPPKPMTGTNDGREPAPLSYSGNTQSFFVAATRQRDARA